MDVEIDVCNIGVLLSMTSVAVLLLTSDGGLYLSIC